MKYILAVLVWSLSSFGTLAWADWDDEIDPQSFALSGPPRLNSPEEKADLDAVLALQSARTPAQCALAGHQVQPSFQATIGDSGVLTAAEVQRVQPLARRVLEVGDQVVGYQKKLYKRMRPYDRDSRVQPCVKKPGGQKSYPSSHAMTGTLLACVLTPIFPERAAALAQAGEQVGDLRKEVGVHFPTDVQAGQDLGLEICHRLERLPEYVKFRNSL